VDQQTVTAINIRNAVAWHMKTLIQIFNFCQNFWDNCSPAALMDKLLPDPAIHSGVSENLDYLGCGSLLLG
jgi:phospholipase C